MMLNLFSMFDPSTNFINLPLNWMSTMLFILLVPMIYWLIPNNTNILYYKIINLLLNEFKIILNSNYKNNFCLLFISLFMFILINNLLGLFPYIFTSTSHLILNMTMSLPMWLSMMMFGWLNNFNKMFIHLVPQSTPILLIPFMTCIETISNFIRPLTLTVRLSANMIAGHLLLTLLGNLGNKLNFMLPLLMIIQIILIILELSVSIIQSYVFSTLLTLYAKEI